MKPRFSTQRLILSLLIILSLYSPSLHARRVYLFISKDDFNDAASSSPEHEPAVFDDPMRIPDPGSWSPLFDPDMNPEAVNGSYYAAVSELMSAASKGNARMMAGAAAEIESAANDGDPHAQSVLAFLYGAGIMRERNEAKALMYHHFATQGGSFQSKMALAYTYYRQGMYEKAAKLYAEIAKTGVKSFLTSKDSPVVEPIMIHDGAEEDKEVLMNFHGEEDESFKMLVKEAEEGNAGAMYRIGMIHLLGLRGLRVDHAKALSWLSKAADKGEPESMYLLGEMYATGVVCVERNYTKALELLTLASEQHLYAAYDRMGYLYLNGYGVDKDYTKAIEYFQKAAENDGAGGHYNLGLMYLKGTGVKRNVQLAIKYFLIAANSGYDLAFYQLAKRFHTGVGLKKNLPMAAELYKLIAEYGPWNSLSRWGLESYIRGDVGKAFLLYSRMAEQGYEVAQSNAAWILDKYGERSMCMGESRLCTDAERHQRAHSLWQQASKQGNEYAASRIGDA